MPELISNASNPPSSDDPAEPPESTPQIDLLMDVAEPAPPLTGWLVPMLARAARAAGVNKGRIGLRVTDDAEMTALHEQYSHEPGTTDVLTFDLRDAPGSPDEPMDGDIVICLDEARRQASLRRHDTRQEVLLYAIHGLLHLLGEDDHDDAAYERMHRREDQLLAQIGLPPVFARSESEAQR